MDDPRKPGDFIREELDARGWTQSELATIVSRPPQAINEILQGKKAITPDTAAALGAAFGTGAEVWMQREADFRLSNADVNTGEIERRARLYDLAPIKEMEKRGWIVPSEDSASLEKELARFFGQSDLSTEPVVSASLRSSFDGPVNASQRAWCFRALQMARCLPAAPYTSKNLDKAIKQLRRLAAWPESAAKVSKVLADAGIRFVILEPLPKTRIDGAALWLNDSSPVVALSARFDRVDSFWHTLAHEISHIRHRDGAAIDVDIVGESRPSPPELSDVERRADSEAAATWVDPKELQEFIIRVGPLYSSDRINQFANRIKMHPGIIVGQLQYRGEIGYGTHKSTLVKIRDFVVSEALTDGWGHSVKISS